MALTATEIEVIVSSFNGINKAIKIDDDELTWICKKMSHVKDMVVMINELIRTSQNAHKMDYISSAFLQKMCNDGNILVNDKNARENPFAEIFYSNATGEELLNKIESVKLPNVIGFHNNTIISFLLALNNRYIVTIDIKHQISGHASSSYFVNMTVLPNRHTIKTIDDYNKNIREAITKTGDSETDLGVELVANDTDILKSHKIEYGAVECYALYLDSIMPDFRDKIDSSDSLSHVYGFIPLNIGGKLTIAAKPIDLEPLSTFDRLSTNPPPNPIDTVHQNLIDIVTKVVSDHITSTYVQGIALVLGLYVRSALQIADAVVDNTLNSKARIKEYTNIFSIRSLIKKFKDGFYMFSDNNLVLELHQKVSRLFLKHNQSTDTVKPASFMSVKIERFSQRVVARIVESNVKIQYLLEEQIITNSNYYKITQVIENKNARLAILTPSNKYMNLLIIRAPESNRRLYELLDVNRIVISNGLNLMFLDIDESLYKTFNTIDAGSIPKIFSSVKEENQILCTLRSHGHTVLTPYFSHAPFNYFRSSLLYNFTSPSKDNFTVSSRNSMLAILGHIIGNTVGNGKAIENQGTSYNKTPSLLENSAYDVSSDVYFARMGHIGRAIATLRGRGINNATNIGNINQLCSAIYKGIVRMSMTGQPFEISPYYGANPIRFEKDKIVYGNQEISSNVITTTIPWPIFADKLANTLLLKVDNQTLIEEAKSGKNNIASSILEVLQNRKNIKFNEEIHKHNSEAYKGLSRFCMPLFMPRINRSTSRSLTTSIGGKEVIDDHINLASAEAVTDMIVAQKIIANKNLTKDSIIELRNSANSKSANSIGYERSLDQLNETSYKRESVMLQTERDIDFNTICSRYIDVVCSIINDTDGIEIMKRHLYSDLTPEQGIKDFINLTIGTVKANVGFTIVPNGILYSINHYRVRREEIGTILKRGLCFNTQEAYNQYIEDVSRISLRARELLNNGIRIKVVINNKSSEILLEFDRHINTWYLVIRDSKDKILNKLPIIGGIATFVNFYSGRDYTASRKAGKPQIIAVPGLVQLLSKVDGMNVEIFRKIVTIGMTAVNEKLARSRKLLEETAKTVKAEYLTISGSKGPVTGYKVKGRSGKEYFVTCDRSAIDVNYQAAYEDVHGTEKIGVVYALPSFSYVCIVDKSQNQAGYDQVINRLLALRNDSVVTSAITTLSSHVAEATNQRAEPAG